jgi:hypothetical protein
MRDNIFTYINNVVFSKKTVSLKLHDEEIPAPQFLLQRWCSMIKSKDYINIINNTTNRWLFTMSKIHLYKLYVECLPQQKRQKINYIKKLPREEDSTSVPDTLEISKREFEQNNKLLKFLTK